jgi:polysaccharide export outer membrane protein
LVGELGVAGLTPMEAADLLTERLEASFLQRATVTMRVVEFRSRPISVIGAVRRPGNLELSGRWNLLDALTDAGGLAEGHGEVVNILRRASNGLHDQLTISLDDLLIRADPTVNIPIFSNDVISVPSAAPITVYLMGEVGTTGAMTFRANQRPTLLTAIAQAGGLTKRAASKISVKRQRDDGSRHEIVVRYKRLLSGEQEDLPLEDGDLIVVKESFL